MTAGPMAAAVAETHSATVVFLGDRAYKCKKPVDLGFLDFTTRAAREAVCHEEVRLNRRLAPDVYLGVADVRGPDGELCEHLVVMRRLPAERRLSRLLADAPAAEAHLWQVAHRMAAFHASAPRLAAADEAAGVVATRQRWVANTDALIEQRPALFDDAVVGLVHGLACRYLDGRAPLLEARVAAGRAVDGHGDLLADDIFCLDDGPRILDCLEFDQRLRLGDGLADVAFLAMDLEHLGHPGLAAVLLAAYGEHRGDAWPASLAHHHIAYRAQVRAKVTAIRAQQGDPTAVAEATGLLDLALEHLEAGRVRLVVVGGLPGTGKSTLAAALGNHLGAVVLRSDEVRHERSRMSRAFEGSAPFETGAYAPHETAQVYDVLLARAATALSMGQTVVLDASWIDPAARAAAREVARRSAADLVELRCVAPAAVAHERIARRRAHGTDPSDATPAIAAAMAGRAAEWPEALVLDTDREPSRPLAEAIERIERGTTRRARTDPTARR